MRPSRPCGKALSFSRPLNRLPHTRRRERHVEHFCIEWRERVVDRVHHRAGRAGPERQGATIDHPGHADAGPLRDALARWERDPPPDGLVDAIGDLDRATAGLGDTVANPPGMFLRMGLWWIVRQENPSVAAIIDALASA